MGRWGVDKKLLEEWKTYRLIPVPVPVLFSLNVDYIFNLFQNVFPRKYP